MKKQEMIKRLLCLCTASLLALSLAACDKQTNEQNSAPPTASVQPTPEPTPTPLPIPYTDVAEDSPYYDAVVWAYENGIASDGETFGPADTCTRGQVITFLWRAMGSPEPWIMENPFSDASPDAWYYKPALWAYQHNIATSTTVNPGNPCTSAEALTFLWRAEGKPDKLNTLAASDTYYAQPVGWADKNGLFAGTEFDPAAPCTRADLMAYLYWATEQWTPSEEEQRIQTEYDKILYKYYASSWFDDALGYADYVDVDGDGKEELLTLELHYDDEAVAVAVYADIDGHIEKSCEGIFRVVGEWENTPVDTFLTNGGVFSLYSSDGQLYLCQNRSFYHYSTNHDLYDFYKIGKEAITFCEQRDIWTFIDRETLEVSEGDTGTSRSYTKQKDILRSDSMGIFWFDILDKGIAPSWEEGNRFWTAYWEASDPMYAAVLRGDFSAFAGNYAGGSYEPDGAYNGETSITINKDGTGTDPNAESVLSVIVREGGEIYVMSDYDERVQYEWGYTIYPPGCAADLLVRDEPSKVRISIWHGTAGAFDFLTPVS